MKLFTINWLRDIAGFLTVIVATCYITGFLIKNIYLSTYNIPSKGFAQLSYISTGVLFLSMLIVPIVPFLLSFSKNTPTNTLKTTLKTTLNANHIPPYALPNTLLDILITPLPVTLETTSESDTSTVPAPPTPDYALVNFFISFIVYIAIVCFVFSSSPFFWNLFWLAVSFFVFVTFTLAIITGIYILFFAGTSIGTIIKNYIMSDLGKQTMNLTIVVFVITFLVTPYATSIYPFIPQSLAGGYPEVTRLFLDYSKINDNQISLLERSMENRQCLPIDETVSNSSNPKSSNPKICKSAEILLLDES